MTRLFAGLVLLALLSGCQRAPAETATTQPPSTPGATTPASEPAPVASTSTPQPPAAAPPPAVKPVPAQLPDVLARVNGESIGRAEFERAIKTVEARAGQPVPPEQRDQVFRGVLEQLVAYHILVQESKARKIAITDGEVEAQLAEIRKQFPSEDAFKQALAERSMTLDALKQETRQEMTLSRLVEAEVSPLISVQERDVKEFYDKNPDKFQQPEAVRASHILIRLEPNATDAQKQDARGKATALLAKVKGGADFAATARESSQDGSAAQGGDLNFFVRGQMVPPFEQAAFAMQPGQISDIVETQFGYHIIKVTERRAPRTVPLAEVAGRIGQFLTSQQQQEKTEAFIAGLRAKSRVEILM